MIQQYGAIDKKNLVAHYRRMQQVKKFTFPFNLDRREMSVTENYGFTEAEIVQI